MSCLLPARGWEPAGVATASAGAWLDHAALTKLDAPVLTDHRGPDEAKGLPKPNAVILAPATFNTVNKLATGIADTYALSVLCGAVGTRTPMVIVPFVNTRLAGHPAWLASLAVLRYAGATLVDPRDGTVNAHEPLQSGTDEAVSEAFNWEWALDQLD
jgi:phosphopantothenoylcysteine synthetase/decarboxylase